MKIVRMTMISRAGTIVNEWTVPYHRRHDALDHALDRAEQEGHAGVLWALTSNGKVREVAFDSHTPEAALTVMAMLQPYMTPKGLNVDKFLGKGKGGGAANAGRSQPARA